MGTWGLPPPRQELAEGRVQTEAISLAWGLEDMRHLGRDLSVGGGSLSGGSGQRGLGVTPRVGMVGRWGWRAGAGFVKSFLSDLCP